MALKVTPSHDAQVQARRKTDNEIRTKFHHVNAPANKIQTKQGTQRKGF